ncbi:MAG: inorganic phosphate transporter [Armatimonadota bacterium]|nr:inorganic phosphate transporter [Armatimonadota bacterium]
MPDATIILLGTVVVLALAFDFINGFHDTANAIATSVLTRALSIRNAIFLSAMQNFVGAMMWTGVAQTIGKGIVDPSLVTGKGGQILVLSALVGAITWNLITWYFGLPSSSSHALIGGVMGAAVAYKGIGVLNEEGLKKIFISLIGSPIVGFLAGATLMILVMNIFAQQAPSKLNRYFKVLQVLSANFMAFTHGSNDAQKSMGIITMALVVGGFLPTVQVPLWVKVTCAAAMALGTAAGGWRIIKTVGKKIMGLQPVHGFASETAAALVVLSATLWHAPVSTTHVISSSVMGVGSAKRLSAVRWGIVGQIVLAWLMTLPISALLSMISYALLHIVLH